MWKVKKEVKERAADLSGPRPGTCSDQEPKEKSLTGAEYANRAGNTICRVLIPVVITVTKNSAC